VGYILNKKKEKNQQSRKLYTDAYHKIQKFWNKNAFFHNYKTMSQCSTFTYFLKKQYVIYEIIKMKQTIEIKRAIAEGQQKRY
jgi:hypothetical protein